MRALAAGAGPHPVAASVYSNWRRYLLVLRFEYVDYKGVKHLAAGGMTIGVTPNSFRTTGWSVGALPDPASLGPATALQL